MEELLQKLQAAELPAQLNGEAIFIAPQTWIVPEQLEGGLRYLLKNGNLRVDYYLPERLDDLVARAKDLHLRKPFMSPQRMGMYSKITYLYAGSAYSVREFFDWEHKVESWDSYIDPTLDKLNELYRAGENVTAELVFELWEAVRENRNKDLKFQLNRVKDLKGVRAFIDKVWAKVYGTAK